MGRIKKIAVLADAVIDPTPLGYTEYFSIGRLGLKQEPAGKVRVFAMVDCWTQWLLKPLHLAIFELLKHLPMDGTFDQVAPIHRLTKAGHTRF